MVSVFLGGIFWQDAHAESPRVSSLDDYPPAITQHLLAEFALQQQTIKQQRLPASVDELPTWNPCGADQPNAYPLISKAFGEEVPSAKLHLLVEAAALTCYQYPYDVKRLKHSTRKYSAIDLEFMSGMREAARLIANEIVLQTALGETELAVRNSEAGLGLLTHLGKSPLLVEQLSRYACQRLILTSFQDMLSSLTLTEAQLERLDQALSRAHDPALLARVWIVEILIFGDEDPFASAPVIHVIDARSRGTILAARTAVAVERHLLAGGKLPVSLAELVPDLLTNVPIDPFNGEPLRYVTSTESYAVFSVDGDGDPCPNPLEIQRGEETTLVRLPIVKQARPLSEMSYSMTSGDGKKNTRAEKKAIGNVASIAAKAIRDQTSKIIMLSAGPLDDGIAVMVDAFSSSDSKEPLEPVFAAFWVHQGVIHTVNTWAKDLAPHLPQAPEAVTFDRVRDVVH